MHDIPRTVLRRRLKGQPLRKGKVGAPTAVSAEDEKSLVEFIIELADRGFGKDVKEIRKIARKIIPQRDKEFKATTTWWTSFQRRHPVLARRTVDDQAILISVDLTRPDWRD